MNELPKHLSATYWAERKAQEDGPWKHERWTWDDKITLRIGETILNDEEIWQIIGEFNDGRCPCCWEPINVGETICDDCFARASHYRAHGPPIDWR